MMIILASLPNHPNLTSFDYWKSNCLESPFFLQHKSFALSKHLLQWKFCFHHKHVAFCFCFWYIFFFMGIDLAFTRHTAFSCPIIFIFWALWTLETLYTHSSIFPNFLGKSYALPQCREIINILGFEMNMLKAQFG